MNIFKPFQLMQKQSVIEQNNQFYFVVSATLSFRLSDGSALLEMGAMGESIKAMGKNPVPDFGMPKPKAEYLVSGSYYALGGEAVRGDEVKVEFGTQSKTLYVFGDRSWQMGIPSKPELITQMPLDYSRAFGGSDYPKNPVGIGHQQEQLPNIENPHQLLTSASVNIVPAGLGPIDLSAEQKRRFQGTYDDSYLQKYYPGYPDDFDWHYFMSAAEDQWSKEYYVGDETYALHNLHPDQPLIKGKLPGFTARCFAQLAGKPELQEVALNLDTVWFFPGSDLGQLIWRGGFDVDDDEATSVKHLLLAYENQKDAPRDLLHYETAFAGLVSSKGSLLSQLSSDDLIPVDEKCALQILQDNALQDTEESAFEKNMDAKAKKMAALTSEKVDDAIKEMKSSMPADAPPQSHEMLDLEKMLKNPPPVQTDADVIELNKILEKILPGITAGDPKKLQLKGFTLDKIDEIMLAVDKFQQKKQAFATEQVEKATDEMRANVDQQMKTMDPESNEATKNLQESLAQLEMMDNPPPSPLPRIDASAILGELDQLSPQTMEAMQNLQTLKAMGGDDETTRQLEEMINQATQGPDQKRKDRMFEVEADFKLMYRDTAHFQVDGVSPHNNTLEERRQEFLDALSLGKPVRGQDWSCINLSGLQLDGVDLSDAYLEQVDLSGASLQNTNLSGAIMARAKLNSADFCGSNLENANLGAVSARGTNFADSDLSSATLSKGNFTNAIFTNAQLNAVEVLEIVIDKANFSGAEMDGFQFIEIEMQGVNFSSAQLPSVAFLQCHLSQCDFSSAHLPTSIWANCSLIQCSFNGALMTNACFTSTDPETGKLEQASFAGACLDRANFQGVDMQRADLSAASMIGANFSSANLYGANLSGAIAHNALFRKTILTNASLKKIDLREGSLAKAHMTGANISGANLYAVDFLRSTMGDTLFDGCNLDRTIIQHWRPS
jgi:uncharacterized protein YjbI with pentapeptide repeats